MITVEAIIQLIHAGADVTVMNIDMQTLIDAIKHSHATLQETKQELAKVTKELGDQRRYYKNSEEANKDLRSEINQVHTVLDSLDGCPPKKIENGDYYSPERSLMTRLFVYLAQRKI